jgi:hypothetical protein
MPPMTTKPRPRAWFGVIHTPDDTKPNTKETPTVTPHDLKRRLETLTGIDAITLAARTATHPLETTLDEALNALEAHGLEESLADLLDEALPYLERNANLDLVPYAVRHAVKRAVNAACAAVIGKDCLENDSRNALLTPWTEAFPFTLEAGAQRMAA